MRGFRIFCLIAVLFWAGSAFAQEWQVKDFEALFLEAAAERLTWLPGELKILRFAVEPQRLDLPPGAKARVVFRGIPKLGANAALIEFSAEGKLLATVRAVGYLEAEIPVVVLRRPLPRHAILHRKDLAIEKRPASRLPRDVLTEIEAAVGKRLRLGLRAGQVLREYALEEPPVVKRGSLVKIVARGEAFTVSALGKARQEGRPGEIIKVRNLNSKREIFARVVGPETVEVNF